MTRHRILTVLLTTIPLLTSACSGSGGDETAAEDTLETTPPIGTPGDGGGGLAALEAEYMGIQQRLAPVQSKAMEDPALQAEFESLEAAVEEAMLGLDPEAADNQERLVALQTEFQAAQASGDTLKSQSILQEGNTLSAKVQQTRAAAFQQEAVVTKLNVFQEKVVARMVEIDPEAQALIDRASDLATQLQAPAP